LIKGRIKSDHLATRTSNARSEVVTGRFVLLIEGVAFFHKAAKTNGVIFSLTKGFSCGLQRWIANVFS